jgi:nucleotide-binding universal stress UspA family protein
LLPAEILEMTIATVMVSLALGQSNEARLEIAGQLAERFGAGIVGIAAAQFAPPLYFTDGQYAQDLIDRGEAEIKKRLLELETQFRQATKNRAAILGWRSALDFPARFILQQARCADIIVDGGRSPAASDAFALASPKDLVMQTGRPLLVVADTANWLDLRSVLVAWKNTPEARRAVADAVPLLQKAKDVTVAEILEQGGSRADAEQGVKDIVAWLSRHGVSAAPRVSENNQNHGATVQLDEIASEVGAGLIVAGAYGHSRFRELIVGGMTQHLVTQNLRCVLLSH